MQYGNESVVNLRKMKPEQAANKQNNDVVSGERILGLDGLRAIAIFGVIFYHMFPFTVKGGFLGVSFFFVLSGYLIALTSERSRRKRQYSISGFAIKRFKRIFPPVLLSVFITVGIFYLLAPKAVEGIRSEIISIILGYNNWWQIFQNSSYFTKIANASPFTHIWSLALEMQFYVLWPLLYFWYVMLSRVGSKRKGFSNRGLWFLGVIGIVSAVEMWVMMRPGMDATRVYYGTDTRLYALMFGTFLGMRRASLTQVKKASARFKKIALAAYALLMIFLLFAFFFFDGQSTFTYRGGMQLVTLAFCAVMVLTADARLPFGKLLEWAPLRWAGQHSYEMYLWMYPVIFLFSIRKWTRLPGAPLLEIIVILLLATWEHKAVEWIVKKEIVFEEGVYMTAKRVAFFVATVLFTAAFMLGACTSVTSGRKNTDTKVLEKQLKENEKRLKAEHKEKEKEENGKDKEQKTEEIPSVTTIGDSVMLGAAPALEEALPQDAVVDAKESRQVLVAKKIVKHLKKKNKLGHIVVVALGTNGPFKESLGQELIDTIGADRKVYWVNVYGPTIQWEDDSNKTIKAVVNANDNVELVDWNSYAKRNEDWFYQDGIHLKPSGQPEYAKMIYSAIEDDLLAWQKEHDVEEK
ncbi:Peptidoglycan/LPS O-acetylase OafA/YrhL, contains acyltransferase and SGNH-hydrolase domains [Lachnospiraceae bacterium KHCPX20]|nr:Peptidoglycan/LPS O-acetylase OafA/YrhL, contains acyltransferase and SGNH-hydrolase domains [Lachnospiraceae bacterium KHCPX20]